jgi:hypothetical protein
VRREADLAALAGRALLFAGAAEALRLKRAGWAACVDFFELVARFGAGFLDGFLAVAFFPEADLFPVTFFPIPFRFAEDLAERLVFDLLLLAFDTRAPGRLLALRPADFFEVFFLEAAFFFGICSVSRWLQNAPAIIHRRGGSESPELSAGPEDRSGQGNAGSGRPVWRAVLRDNGRINPAAQIECCRQTSKARAHPTNKIIQDRVCNRLMKCASVPIGPNIKFQRFQFDTLSFWNILEVKLGKIRLARLRAETGELGHSNANRVIA